MKIENAVGVEPTGHDMKRAAEAIDLHVQRLCENYSSGPRDDQFCYRVDIVKYQRIIKVFNKPWACSSGETGGGDEVFSFPA